MIMGVAFSNKLCDKKVVFIKLVALIAQSHLLKQRALCFKATSELVFVLSLQWMQLCPFRGRVPHVTGSPVCAKRKFKDLKESLREHGISFL